VGFYFSFGEFLSPFEAETVVSGEGFRIIRKLM